jgi:hypothetical protein
MIDCPSIAELTSAEILPPILAAHVRDCSRCQALRQLWEANPPAGVAFADEATVEAKWPFPPHPNIDAPARPGAIHCVWGAEDGELLPAVIMDVDEVEALVIPISPDIDMAGDGDVFIDQHVLAYPAIAEVWNHLRVLAEQIVEQIGELEATVHDTLDSALDAMLASEPLPEGLRQGPELIGELDPRALFREREAERARKFVEPWRALNLGATLGAVLGSRRTECDLALDEVGERTDLAPDALHRLEEDREDLQARVSIASMTALVRQMNLTPSRKLADLVELAVFDNDREPEPGPQVELARRRVGARSAGRPPSEETRRKHAQDYAQRLLARLAER